MASLWQRGGSRASAGARAALGTLVLALSVATPFLPEGTATAMVLRWLVVIGSAIGFFLVTPPHELSRALQLLRIPESASLAIGAGLRFAPIVAQELERVTLAQRARGWGGLWNTIRTPHVLLLPLMLGILTHASETWIAMQLRQRVRSLAVRRLRIRDWVVIGTSALVAFGTLFTTISSFLK